MKIKVKQVHNTQALEVTIYRFKFIDGDKVLVSKKESNWEQRFRNNMEFIYENDRLNGKAMFEPSQEALEGARGNY